MLVDKPVRWVGSSLKDTRAMPEDAIYVLHAFKKKSKSGISTPKQDMDLIRMRLRQAQEASNEQRR
jgi:phage-related protein